MNDQLKRWSDCATTLAPLLDAGNNQQNEAPQFAPFAAAGASRKDIIVQNLAKKDLYQAYPRCK